MSDATRATPAKDDTTTLGGLLAAGFTTPGVKNIEAAYSRAGAANHHTPGAASLGSQDQEGASENQGFGSRKFSEGISDQRQEPSLIGKAFNNMINGTGKTK
ncbi:hypothetical protein B2J93_9012 [Marssonina coronariae]|uniref:Uncharacterized protein n=1 Tax=Diplocarpon coronariae TaxID=2795749 RepID=A0A218ZIS6_9HELO|nr:hypothetical protein JHW43_009297 [Diplocarpon mali]OWP07560.1 hypothetical protein B2J93_9012 [Marssonina coronariae]